MPRIPLTSGAYSSRSVIANAQRCVNLYPESAPQETNPPTPVTHYLRPGLTLLGSFADGTVVRCLYTATNGDLYAVCGASVYFIDGGWQPNFVGTIIPGTLPVKMADNGVSILVVDGSTTAYQIEMSNHTMSGVTASNSSGTNGFEYDGANYVDYMDTFLVGNRPNTPDWWSTASNAIQLDTLSFASKSGLSDYTKGVAVVDRYVWVIGTYASEIWYDAGGTNFPFALAQGPYIEHGCLATYSIVKALECVCWLSQDRYGKGIFLRGQQYTATKCSNYAIEAEINTYPDLDLTVGFSFQQKGHTFAGWRFPTADKTWVLDLDTGQWSEWLTEDSNGLEHQWRVNCTAFAYGQNVGGDFSNGIFYLIDPDNQTDNGVPVMRRRGFPHVQNDLKRVRHNQFVADIECGNIGQTLPGVVDLFADASGGSFALEAEGGSQLLLDPFPPAATFGTRDILVRYSDSRGHSWANPLRQTLGEAGQYLTNVQWRQLGYARDRVYEVYWTYPTVSALQGAFIDVGEGKT